MEEAFDEPYSRVRECAMESGVGSQESGVTSGIGVTKVTKSLSYGPHFWVTF